MIPLCAPKLGGNEQRYIKECLDTNWVSSAGKFVDRFEASLADYLNRRYAVACTNGTAALHIAILVAEVKPQEEVLVPALTFVAPVNALCYAGARPVFMDVEKDTWQLDPQKVKDFLIKECRYQHGRLINRYTKRIVKGVLPVHILGHPVDMGPLLELAKRFNLNVIEDAAESLGAEYKGRKVGALGDIACLSFNGNKIITTGGGGMIVTNNKAWGEKARYLTTQAKDDPLEYVHQEIGYNYRLSNIQAALGVAQMERLDKHVSAKRRIARRYQENLAEIKALTLPTEAKWAKSIFWLYTVLVDSKSRGPKSRDLIRILKKAGIEARPLWHPIHRLKPYQDCYAYDIKVIDRLYREGVSLPSSVGLTEKDQDKVIAVLKKALKG